MPAIRVVEAVRGLPPPMAARNLQISAQNIQIMNGLMRTELTTRINGPAGPGGAPGLQSGGPGSSVDVRA